MRAKDLFHRIIPQNVWNALRLQRILRNHKRIAVLCNNLIEDCLSNNTTLRAKPLKQMDSENIIWQYWAQGFENVPPIISDCLASVDRNKGDYHIIRLTDTNYSEYIQFPESILPKIPLMSKAHFSDILRVSLLEAYGGVWMDATIMLTGKIPDEYLQMSYFIFQRDANEPDKDYWENAYAYYFGWSKGFRVNMLNSFIVAKKNDPVISLLADSLLLWWHNNDSLPDYFFFQILYDVLIEGRMKQNKCPVVSDCRPHYLQQAINDPNFNILERKRITEDFHIHKLTYKQQKYDFLRDAIV